MRRVQLETFLLALGVILLEVSYTRVFSFKLVYYFTYLVIGVALLGLGSGGVLVALSERLRRASVEQVIIACAAIASLGALTSYALAVLVPLHLLHMVMFFARGERVFPAQEAIKLAVVVSAVFVPFLAAGIALAKIFASETEHIAKLYFADLVGAALGCALVIPALVFLTPPGTVFLSAAILGAAGLRFAARAGASRLVVVAAVVALASVAVVVADRFPDPVRDRVKGGARVEAQFSAWSPVFRVDVVPVPSTSPETKFLVHDGLIGSSILGWDGDVASLGRYDRSDRSFPFRLLAPGPRVAIVGSAGGNEILASLRLGASEITGIELNPVTISLLTDHFADFTGHLTENPKVSVVNAEGRSYLEGSGREFDLIWFVAPDSYAAMNAATSGAFVLSESYLYTQEMIETALEHLSGEGILAAQFGEIDFDVKPNRVVRYLGTAREALADLGIGDFGGHVLVAVSPGFGRLETATILLRRTPFTPPEVAAFRKLAEELPGTRVIWAGPGAARGGLVGDAITLEGAEREQFYARQPYKVHPITDDAPFFWHFVRFQDALLGGSGTQRYNVEEGVGERLLVVFLVLAGLLAAVFLLAPLILARRLWSSVPFKLESGVYFAALGLGFMFIEVCLIQKLTLFLGYPTYSLTVTLFSLLISTGLGSLFSERLVAERNRAYGALGLVLCALVTFYEFGLDPLVDLGIGWPLGLRIVATVVVLAPLGICLGTLMPLGLRSVSLLGPNGEAYVAWCWAVNGFFSVMASVLATILAMIFGFGVVLALGLVIYLLGIAVFSRVPEPA